MLAARVKYEKEPGRWCRGCSAPPESELVSRIFLAECSLLSSWQMNLCLPGEGVEEKAEGDRFLARNSLSLFWSHLGEVLLSAQIYLRHLPDTDSRRRLNQIIKHARINPHLANCGGFFIRAAWFTVGPPAGLDWPAGCIPMREGRLMLVGAQIIDSFGWVAPLIDFQTEWWSHWPRTR